jgi:alkaline phosphatase
VVEEATELGYRYVTDADGLAAVAANKPVLGLFNDSNMSLEWTGPAASLGKGNAPAPCTEGLPTGYSTNLATKDGQTLSLTYGTAGYEAGKAPATIPASQQHTGAAVPVWAAGPGGLAVLGTNDHTDLFTTLSGH